MAEFGKIVINFSLMEEIKLDKVYFTSTKLLVLVDDTLTELVELTDDTLTEFDESTRGIVTELVEFTDDRHLD